VSVENMNAIVEIRAESPVQVESSLCSRFRCTKSQCTACAAVCPVDCCVPDPNHVETEEQLFERAKILHPDRQFAELSAATSHFRK